MNPALWPAAVYRGEGTEGQLGNGGTSSSAVPVMVASGGLLFTSISCATGHTCAVQATTAAAHCWGKQAPRSLVVCGSAFSKARHHDATLTVSSSPLTFFNSGRNYDAQLGSGGFTTHSAVPVPVSGGLPFAAISVGDGHSCGRQANGSVWCW